METFLREKKEAILMDRKQNILNQVPNGETLGSPRPKMQIECNPSEREDDQVSHLQAVQAKYADLGEKMEEKSRLSRVSKARQSNMRQSAVGNADMIQ